ncbi:hypothetical protein I4U23_005923 [Adineta vaga]|nr:hypothetical protein I4U23_005923 [Adineta vaga]
MALQKCSSIEFIVDFMYQTFVLQIESFMLDVEIIYDLISNYFCIDMNQYLLEIFDSRFYKYIILDKFYINEIQSNSYFKTIRFYRLRIRSLYKQFTKIQFDTKILLSRSRKESKFYMNDHVHHPSNSFPAISDHVIIWLDAYIGYPQNNRQLKHYFNTTASVDIVARYSYGKDLDIDNLIGSFSANTMKDYQMNDKQKQILFTFSKVDTCVKFINQLSHSNTTIFMITTGALGRRLVPQIFDNRHIYAIYVFTCNLLTQIDWALNYIDKILMFDHELDLLSRLTKDIASYYVQKAFASIEDSRQSLNYLSWSKKLLNKTNFLDKRNYSTERLKQIETLINQIEMYGDDTPMDFDGTKFSIDCTEG